MDRAGQQRVFLGSWRKSSYSSGSGAGNCVEVAFGAEAVLLRDSKNAAGPSLAFADGNWQVFLAELG
jgi:hypothetical protein